MLTVSIVTYQTPDTELLDCLDSLISADVARIIIVDNSSSTATRMIAESRNVYYIPSHNIGYGAAHNIAIRKAIDLGADYHLVINSDIHFNGADLGRMVRFLEQNQDVVALHPDVRNPDGSRQFTARRLPTPIDVFGRRFLPSRVMERRNRKYLLMDADLSKPIDVPYFQGSFMMLRTSGLKDSGLFDERFFMYPEDIDLIRRLHRIGRTLYWPEVKVVHDHHAGSYHSWRLLRIHVINMCRYFSKWGWWHDRERRAFNRRLDSLPAPMDKKDVDKSET